MNKAIFLTLLSSLLIAFNANANQVKQLSAEVFVDGEQRAWEVTVQCAGSAGSKIISKPVSGGDWCASNTNSACHASKETLAQQLCGGELSSAVVSDESTEPVSEQVVDQAKSETIVSDSPVASPVLVSDPALLSMSRSELMEEKMRVEEARIEIQQRHVELRKREIELQKRLLGNS